MVEIKIDQDKCTGCGTCVDVCPTGVYEVKEDKAHPENIDECLVCRICEGECPENAIEVLD